MELRQQIKNYYFKHFAELDDDKKFHFASRLASWQNDPLALEAIESSRDYMTGSGDIPGVLRSIFSGQVRNVYAKELRQEYFDKYPALFGIHNIFFRVRHLKVFYDIDAMEQLLELVSMSELERLYDRLSRDDDAIRVLSRFAVDYLYLFEILFDRPRLDQREIYRQKTGYDLSDPTQRHLFVYLYTHAIIADSNFYHRPVPADRLDLYRLMLKDLEEVFAADPSLKMDTKFEFMVVSRICGYESGLFDKFEKEAAGSLDPGSHYVIEPSAPRPDKGVNDFNRSEHRNVLFVMSGSPYEPLSN